MEITLTSSLLTSLFVGLVVTLIKVVEYFISRRQEKKGLSKPQEEMLQKICQYIGEAEKHGSLTEKQEELLEEINDNTEDLLDMHSVYDENRVPRWYVSADLMPLVRKIYGTLKTLNKELEENISDVKEGQTMLVSRMIDLISSQKLMVERLGDLIVKLDNKS